MWVDTGNIFAEDENCAASDTDSVLMPDSDVIDLASNTVLKDIGAGQPVYLVLRTTAAWGGAGATVTFSLKSDSTEDLATSATTHLAVSVPVPSLTATYKRAFALPADTSYERYLGIWMDVAGDDVTGRMTAFLTADPAFWDPLADAI